jgi:hypothetical protein
MSEGLSVPTEGTWSLATERATHSGYSYAAGADGPLTRAEIAQFDVELGWRLANWREASDAHLADLMRFHRGGGWR